jgi:catechol 2,3-dioxygenase-like lactoylglutathione lyase family enzyme
MAKGLWPVLNVENVDKSIEFYKLLGLRAKKETAMDMTWGSVTVSDDAGLTLWNRRQTGPNQDQPDLQSWLSGDLGKGVLVTIGIPNAKKVWDKVSNMVPVDQALREEPWGGRSFSVVDPDGYVVSLMDKFPGPPTTGIRRRAPARASRTNRRTAAKGKAVKRKGR